MIIYPAIFIATTCLISYIYKFGGKTGRREGFLEGWYFRHTKGGGDVPDDLLEEITPHPCTLAFGNLVSEFGGGKKQAFLKWMMKENPIIGCGPKKGITTFHEYAANRKTDLNGLLEYIEQRKK